jgi:hypothetical protein
VPEENEGHELEPLDILRGGHWISLRCSLRRILVSTVDAFWVVISVAALFAGLL